MFAQVCKLNVDVQVCKLNNVYTTNSKTTICVYTFLNFNRKWFGSEYFSLYITLTQAHL